MQSVNTNFFQKIRGVKKILILDLGFLGDTVHLIPAAYCVRQAFPNAQLEVMVADHILSILQCTPWIDKVLGYPRFPKGPKWYKEWDRIKFLKRQKYDLVINLNGSDRSSFLTFGTGAPVRLGRLHERKKWYWKYLYTDWIWQDFEKESLYIQRWKCLKDKGFPGNEPKFGAEVPSVVASKVDDLLDLDGESFIHVSPFTTEDFKEMPIPVLAEFLNKIYQNTTSKIVISCAPNERERKKCEELLALINFKPWRIFKGSLSLVELAGVIEKAKVHIGGDSGALHIAVMFGTKTLSWFREYVRNRKEWVPKGEGHVHLIGEKSNQGLCGISANDLYEAYKKIVPTDSK